MFVCCECCVLSGKDLCDEPITRPEEFYRLWCVVVCDLETSRMRRPWPALGRSTTANRKKCMHEKLISSLPKIFFSWCRVERTVTVACNLTIRRKLNFKSCEQFVNWTHLGKPDCAKEYTPNHTPDRLPVNALKLPWVASVSQLVSGGYTGVVHIPRTPFPKKDFDMILHLPCVFCKRWNILILLASSQQTCMTYTIAVCTVLDSWWWTEKLSETCRILFQKINLRN